MKFIIRSTSLCCYQHAVLDDIFKRVLLILIDISMNFVPDVPVNDKSALVWMTISHWTHDVIITSL